MLVAVPPPLTRIKIMLGAEALAAPGSDNIAHTIQVALTPVFLLSGIASLLGVFAGRLARVADRVDALNEKLEGAAPAAKAALNRRLAYLRKRSRTLDVAVLLGALAGAATCAAALILFIGTLRDNTVAGFLYFAFGMALACTMGALAAFLSEMLIASRGLRERASGQREDADAAETPEHEEAHAHEPGAAAADSISGES